MSTPEEVSAKDLAWRVTRERFERDRVTSGLGMQIEEVGPGMSRLSLTVRPDMLNVHGSCHGGIIFTLADSCFGYACNSRNEASVGAACTIEYLRPAQLGDVLMATAEERFLAGRTGIYDVTVLDATGQIVALFRGRSSRSGKKGPAAE